MKLLLVFPPLRGQADRMPPYGCLSIAQAAAEEGCQVCVLNLDRSRSNLHEALERIAGESPDIIGVSAVTSTTYGFVKALTAGLRRVGVRAPIVVGGNIVASSELLLDRCGVDVCVIGEGYQTIKELIRVWQAGGSLEGEAARAIKGIAYRDPSGALCFSGRRALLDIETVPLVRNFHLIDAGYYIPRVRELDWLLPEAQKARLARLPEEARYIELIVGSGCQNACSFCHRNVHGVRQRSIKTTFEYVDYLIEEHAVRFFAFCDESLFVEPEWIEGFLREVRQREILFRFGGVRADQVVKNEPILKELERAGLVDVSVGLETGSERQLAVMDKHVSAETNRKAVEVLNRLGVLHVPQIILGMPGEDDRSLRETAALLAAVRSANGEASINIAQVLPGTPLYWYALHSGLIRDEESYLLRISDKNAADIRGTVNVTTATSASLDLARSRLYVRSFASNGRYLRMGRSFLGCLSKILRRQVDGSLKGWRERSAFLLDSLTGIVLPVYARQAVDGSLRKLMLRCLREQGRPISAFDKMKFGLLPGAEFERVERPSAASRT